MKFVIKSRKELVESLRVEKETLDRYLQHSKNILDEDQEYRLERSILNSKARILLLEKALGVMDINEYRHRMWDLKKIIRSKKGIGEFPKSFRLKPKL